ncbi:protein of unknown function [Burkholderia multivorans]
MDGKPVIVETAGRVGIATLNRPKQMNALNDALMDAPERMKAFLEKRSRRLRIAERTPEPQKQHTGASKWPSITRLSNCCWRRSGASSTTDWFPPRIRSKQTTTCLPASSKT